MGITNKDFFRCSFKEMPPLVDDSFLFGRKSRSLKALRKVTEAQSLRSFKSAVANVVDAWYIFCVSLSVDLDFLRIKHTWNCLYIPL